MTLDAIKTYLDNVFAAYPQTSEIQSLKRDMLTNMEEKYVTLRQSGKSEHEAAYSVIANFGNIEEITAELGMDTKNIEPDDSIFIPLEEAETYLTKSQKSGIWIGLGVWLIIAGASVAAGGNYIFIFIVAIAIAVTMFIINGHWMSAYKRYRETPVRIDKHTREWVEYEYTRFMSRYTIMNAIGVAIIILSAGAFAVVDFPIPLFLNIVGFSVFLFTVAGSCSSAYDVLLGKRKQNFGTKQKERDTSTILN